jgi:hypothetical protein
MSEASDKDRPRDARWPFIALYAFMWAGMIGISLNTDPIRFDTSVAVVLGLAAVAGMVIYLAVGRLRRWSPFDFSSSTLLGNVPRHVFILTGVVFASFLFFAAVIQIMVLWLQVPLFDPSCGLPSQRDVARFVWNAIAHGTFKFFADYLHLGPDHCAVAKTTVAWVTGLCVQWFTSLVVVWYALGLLRAWFNRLRHARSTTGP